LEIIRDTLSGKFKFRNLGIVDIISSTSNFALLIVFVVILEQGLLGLIYARIISRIIAFSYALLKADLIFRFEFDYAILRDVLLFGFPIYIDSILDFIYSRIDTFLISILMGPSDIAFYEIARQIPDGLLLFYSAFQKVYFSFTSKLYAKFEYIQVNQLLNTSIRLFAFFGLFASLVSFIFGHEIITLIFSSRYAVSVLAFAILMIQFTYILIDHTLGYTLIAVGESNKPPLINSVQTVVSLGGYLLLIPVIGIVGAAIASLIGTLIVNPLNIYFLRRKKVNAHFNTFIKPTLVFAACLGIYYAFIDYALVIKLLTIILFPVASLLLSTITLADFQILFRETKKIIANFSKGIAKSNKPKESTYYDSN
jgi:O-antigen/teichoic acid export membrane protein